MPRRFPLGRNSCLFNSPSKNSDLIFLHRLNLALDLIVATLAVIVITLAVNLRGITTGGEIGIALNVILVFNTVLLRLIETWTQMETSLGAIARLKNLEATTVSEDKPGENCLPPADWPQKGCIEFRDVTATYG
jgi:ATP-binding cassette subfamily C (CFTR/MRP) protein 1